MIWVIEIESAKFIAQLKTFKTITGARWQTNFEVLDSLILPLWRISIIVHFAVESVGFGRESCD